MRDKKEANVFSEKRLNLDFEEKAEKRVYCMGVKKVFT
jgi:hypothetical protein